MNLILHEFNTFLKYLCVQKLRKHPALQILISAKKTVIKIGKWRACESKISCRTTKPTKWHLCPAKTQISLGICQSDQSSLCTQGVAKDPRFLHADSKHSDQTGLMPRLIWVFAGCTGHFVGLQWLKWCSVFFQLWWCLFRSSAAHIIAEFTKKALLGRLPQEAGPPPSHAVIGAYLYICRQIYNTCEGLLVLYPYELHKVVAEIWQEVSSLKVYRSS